MKARLNLILLAATAVIATATGATAIGATPKPPFRVTSTLDGKTVLPHHIHWYANAPSTKLRKIDFLIDGKLRWVQRKPYYIYGDLNDDLGKVDRGYLVTSWLTPGLHRFSAERRRWTDGSRLTP